MYKYFEGVGSVSSNVRGSTFRRSFPSQPTKQTSWLASLLLSVLANKKVPAKAFRSIIESQLFVQPVQDLQILAFELEVSLQVALDARGSFAFWQYRVPVVDAPR